MKVRYLDLPSQIASIRGELEEAIKRTIDNCSFCLGPDVSDFEAKFAEFCGVKYCVSVNSGTSALHLAMLVMGVGPGDEVITTPHTFVATSWAISYVGARPVYVDIDDSTCNINPVQVEAAITSKTKAILPVHLYGLPCNMDPLLKIADKYEVPLIEDAAQAHGSSYKGRVAGSIGRAATFSFYPGKNLGALGEGGAFVTNDRQLAEHARSLREHGSTKRYYHDEVGYNYRMEGIQGAVLAVKLKYLSDWNASRRRVSQVYSTLLKDTPLKLPSEPIGYSSAWHLYVVRHPRRDELKDFLLEQGIETALHYPVPLHLQKCYANLDYKKGDFPVAEQAASECLSLPIYPELADDQIEYISQKIKSFFNV